jgi:hypothetical protein
MNAPKDGKVDYQSLLNLSSDDLNAKIRSGEIVVPKSTQERERLATFSNLAPGSPERQLIADAAAGKEPGSEPQPEPQPSEPPKAEEPAPKPAPAEPEPKGPEPAPQPAPAPEPSATPWWQERGYESEEEAVGAIDTLRGAVSEQQQKVSALQRQVDEKNAQDGKLGRELKEARDKLARLEAAQAGRAPSATAPGEPAQMPTRPNPNDPKYEDGLMDEKYLADLDAYEQARDAKIASLSDELAKTRGRVDEVSSTVTESQKAREKAQADTANGRFWETLRDFQKKFGLTTTQDIRTINDNVNSSEGGRAYWASLPKADQVAFNKVAKAAQLYATMENGVFKPRYKTVAGALADNGLMGEYSQPTETPLTPEEEKAAREKKRAEQAASASVPGSQSLSSGDEPQGQEMSTEEAKQRLAVLNDIRGKNPMAFQKDEKLFAEFNALLKRFGLKPKEPVKNRR